MTPCEPPPDHAVFLYAARRLLVLLHGAGSIVLIGAATHHALQMRHYLRGRFLREAAEKTWAKVTAVAYLATFALGALLYPSYRVHVRGYFLDRYAPFYAGLFDVKEVYASLTLVVAVGLGMLAASSFRPSQQPAFVRVYAAMSFIVCGIAWFEVLSGLLIVSVRGVG